MSGCGTLGAEELEQPLPRLIAVTGRVDTGRSTNERTPRIR